MNTISTHPIMIPRLDSDVPLSSKQPNLLNNYQKILKVSINEIFIVLAIFFLYNEWKNWSVLMDNTFFNWIIIPLLIMCARIIDVSIGTVRIIFVSKGKEILAAALGFFEVIIWLIAISQVLNNLNNVICYIGYGMGFALGNILGISIEKKLAIGMQIIRIITSNQLETLQMALRDEGYGVTTMDAHGAKSPVKIIYVVCERKDNESIMNLIHSIEPESFITIQDIRSHYMGYVKKKPLLAKILKRK